ncbi:MAG: cache domain-containing protein [Rhodoferax sp.]|nr:cache domain-containing protein [Rhodoferax sp.]
MVSKGTLPEEEGKKLAIDGVRAFAKQDRVLLWINDMPDQDHHASDPRQTWWARSKPTPKDPNGERLFIEFVETVKAEGAGFVDYMWPKPSSTDPQPKVSYLAGFAPRG